MAVGIEEVEITKARTDKREYRRVVLSNSLEVLLISDADTDKVPAVFHFPAHCFRMILRDKGFSMFSNDYLCSRSCLFRLIFMPRIQRRHIVLATCLPSARSCFSQFSIGFHFTTYMKFEGQIFLSSHSRLHIVAGCCFDEC